MMFKLSRYNIYLLSLPLAVLLSGCSSFNLSKPKEAAIIELHLESVKDAMYDVQTVPVNRQNPFYVTVSREAFLNSGDLEDAAVVDELGGFVIRLKFGSKGTQLLSTVSASNPGKHIAIFCITDSSRWLAAPVIRKQLADGNLIFTPDASREEADKIVKGLKEVIKKIKKDSL
jgi:preprotein translocase subunit SecD